MATDPLPRDRSNGPARSPEELDEEVRRYLQGRSRRSFLTAGAAALAGFGLYEGIYRAHAVNGLQWPLRKVAEGNRLLTNAIFRQSVHAPTYSAKEVTGLRVNGDYGIDTGLLLDSWGLRVSGLQGPERYSRFLRNVNDWEYRSTGATTAPESAQPDVKSPGGAAPPAKDAAGGAGGTVPHLQESTDVSVSAAAVPGIVLRLADLRALPYTEQITQFKCVEGWSQIVRWGGVRFSDFLRAFPPGDVDGAPPKFATMETADGAFNASFDMQSLLHPQTLLCYTMDGRPLERYHGAPLRLAMPLKYGYKQIKAIASIAYGNVRTPDYWEKLGYDWYAGL